VKQPHTEKSRSLPTGSSNVEKVAASPLCYERRDFGLHSAKPFPTWLFQMERG